MSGCVYKISSELGKCCYIGKTTKKYPSERFGQHKWEYRTQRYYYSCYEVLRYDDAKFEIIEDNIPIENILIREKEEMRNHINLNLVNKIGIK
tara:strand:- start:559 stop:837 length:279 start_codon:yes stop_codon:yes gene_type:complete